MVAVPGEASTSGEGEVAMAGVFIADGVAALGISSEICKGEKAKTPKKTCC